MPKKRPSFRPQRRPGPRGDRQDSRGGALTLQRQAMPQPEFATTLRLSGGPGDADAAGGMPERWELICRDGWEWQRAPSASGASGGAGTGASSSARPLVWVRRAQLTPDQAAVVGQWIERIRDPAAWWQVSRALQTPESAPDVAREIAANPWLQEVLPAVLEASTDGAPPPPPRQEG
jgi:hypothetical protein